MEVKYTREQLNERHLKRKQQIELLYKAPKYAVGDIVMYWKDTDNNGYVSISSGLIVTIECNGFLLEDEDDEPNLATFYYIDDKDGEFHEEEDILGKLK